MALEIFHAQLFDLVTSMTANWPTNSARSQNLLRARSNGENPGLVYVGAGSFLANLAVQGQRNGKAILRLKATNLAMTARIQR